MTLAAQGAASGAGARRAYGARPRRETCAWKRNKEACLRRQMCAHRLIRALWRTDPSPQTHVNCPTAWRCARQRRGAPSLARRTAGLPSTRTRASLHVHWLVWGLVQRRGLGGAQTDDGRVPRGRRALDNRSHPMPTRVTSNDLVFAHARASHSRDRRQGGARLRRQRAHRLAPVRGVVRHAQQRD